MSFTKDHAEDAIKDRGEVFTPEALVEEMLGKLPSEFFTSADKTMLDNSCGNGNFLVKILEWRMKHGISHLDALKTIYGIEIDDANAKECRERLTLGSKSKKIWSVLENNIICADSLDEHHEGWDKVGYMWNGETDGRVEFRNAKREKERLAKEKKTKKEKPKSETTAAKAFLEL